MKLLDAIEKRRSIRKFSPKKVRWDHLLEAIDAALQAPFSGNYNNLRFLIVQDKELKNKIAEYAQQDWIADATFIVVVCADYKQLKTMYHGQAEIYAKQHAGAAIENFLLRVTDLKLASCWVGAFLEEQIKTVLRIPDEIKIEALLPVGYPSHSKKIKRPRKEPLEKTIYWDFWKISKKPTPFKNPRTW